MKKVLLVIIDALASRIVESELEQGNLPTIQSLIDAGQWRKRSTAIFPSLTLAAKPSIATGQYPRQHGMMGAYWYNQEENRIIYFGDDISMVWQQGFNTFLEDFLIKMNNDWLSADTIFERVERTGKKAASLTWFFYHGLVEHKINHKILSLLPNSPANKSIFGPSTIHLGDFSNHSANVNIEPGTFGRPFNRFGFADDVTANLLLEMAEKKAFPDFTLAYFPDNDFKSHEVGPENAVGVLHKVDGYLRDTIEAYGGLEKFLTDFAIIISGDHSQTDIVEDQTQARIDLEHLLSDFRVSEISTGWGEGEQIIVCPNGRAANLYLRKPTTDNIKAVTRRLLEDPRVDQVICCNEDKGFEVHTQDRGQLHFNPVQGRGMAQDHYQRGWQWSGELGALGKNDIQDGIIEFANYPNSFERIAGLLSAERSGEIWVTAHEGHDFVIPGVKTHPGGGSHGALHILDSSSPLIVAGQPEKMQLPQNPRSVDLVPLCLELLEIPVSELAVGKSHIDPH